MNEDNFIIPADNVSLENEQKTKKDKYMNHIYESFLKNIKDENSQLPQKIELFNFAGTHLQVIIKEEHYSVTLTNLLDYYIETEEYEKCNKIKEIINKLDDTTTTSNETSDK